MKVTFPHMGNAYIALQALFEDVGLEVVLPPPCTKRTLEIGVRHSPEFICLPLKLNVGNFIEALELGADTIVMAGGTGPCRFGYYASLERDILQELGYVFDLMVLEPPVESLKDLLKQIKKLKSGVPWSRLWSAIKLAWEKTKAVDEIEQLSEYWMPRCHDADAVSRLVQQSLKLIQACSQRRAISSLLTSINSSFDRLPRNKVEPLKIGLVGEVYTILEPFANYDIEYKLGTLGAEVTRSVYLSHWVNDNLIGGHLNIGSSRQAVRCAPPYVNHWVGGHGQETVGYSVMLARQGFDGIIQIGPLTCMPEIVAQAILTKVQEVENIPVMTMYFDEHAGEAGIQTRLEAFIDMIKWRKIVTRLA